MSSDNADKADTAKPEWMQRKERGSMVLMRLISRISLLFGRRLSRVVVYGIALYFLLTAPAARKASRAYFERVLGRPATWLDLYKHILSFASTIHDRVFLLNNQFDLFDIRVLGAETVLDTRADNQGMLLFGAHMGSFEALLSHGRSHKLNACIAMYAENAQQLNRTLAAINPKVMAGIIPLGQVDSMLTIHSRLQEGALVGVLADRAAGLGQYVSIPFLGTPARFPVGPFRMAVLLGKPICFMTGVYRGGNRYDVTFEPLADFGEVPRNQREAVVQETMQKYVAALERHCRSAPYNWFNFYDFWESTP